MIPENSKPSPAVHTTATAQVIAVGELDPSGGVVPHGAGDARPAAHAAPRVDLGPANPLRNVKVQLTVCIGGAELTVQELLGARAQQVLRLDRAVDQPVDVLLEGQVVARGTLVAVDDRFGVRITEVPTALELPLGAGAERP